MAELVGGGDRVRVFAVLCLALMAAAPANAGKVRCGPVWVDEEDGCCNFGCGLSGDMCIALFCDWGRPEGIVSRNSTASDPFSQVTLDLATAFGGSGAGSLGVQQYLGKAYAVSARVDSDTDGNAAAGVAVRGRFGRSRWLPDVSVQVDWAPTGSVRVMGSPAVAGAYLGGRLAAGIDMRGITAGLGVGVYQGLDDEPSGQSIVADAHVGWTYDLKTYHYTVPFIFRVEARPWLALDGMRPGFDGTLGIWYRVDNRSFYQGKGMLRFGFDLERRFARETDRHVALAMRIQYYPEANH